MKKNILIYFLGFLLALIATSSCKNEVDDIFDESASQRTEQALKDYKEVLCAAQNGWVMEYFANTGEAGETFLMKFDTNGSVKIAAKNKWISNKYAEETSLYEMIADNGPVLTFNSYNTIFHLFSNPIDIPGTTPDETGTGHAGDYEFVVMSADANKVILNGKKRKIKIILTPLKDGQVWNEYFNMLDNLDAKMFNSKIDTLYLNTPNQKYVITGSAAHEISIYPADGDPITQTEKAVFLVNEAGIRLCEPFNGVKNDLKLQEFKFNDDGSLVSLDDNVSTIIAPDPAYLFSSRSKIWRVDPADMGGDLAVAYQNVVKAVKAKYNMVFQYFQFAANKDTYLLSFRSGSSSGNFYGTETVNGDEVALQYNGTGDKNAVNFLNNVPEFKAFLNVLNSKKFVMKSSSKINPSTIRMEDKGNAENYFMVKIQ